MESPVSWADEEFNEEDDSIHEKLNTLIDMFKNFNDRLKIIETKLDINKTLSVDSIDEDKKLCAIVDESISSSKLVSNISLLTDGGGSSLEPSIPTSSSSPFENILDLFKISFYRTPNGINFEKSEDFGLIDIFIKQLLDFIKGKFIISDAKRRIIIHNLKQYFGSSKYKGIMSTFKIVSDDDLLIAQIKPQTIPEESEADFIHRSSAMILFQETFKTYNSKCLENNILLLLENLFNFKLIELVDNDKENPCIKFRSYFINTLEDIWSYLQIEKECVFHKNGKCKFNSHHGIYTH